MPSDAIAIPVPLHLGRCLATAGARRELARAGVSPEALLRQHQCVDWGAGERLRSVYVLPTGVRVWILTERDRLAPRYAATTLLLPEEF